MTRRNLSAVSASPRGNSAQAHGKIPSGLIAVAAVLTLAAGFGGAYQDEEEGDLWRRAFASEVEHLEVSPLGAVLVQRKDGLSALDLATGHEAWSRPDLTWHRVVSGTPFATAGRDEHDLVVINLETGTDLWSVSALGFDEPHAYHVPALGLMLVSGQTATNAHTLMAVSYASGQVVWRQDGLYASGPLAKNAAKIEYTTRQPMLVAPDLLLLDPKHDGLLGLDPRTGALRWRVPEGVLKEPADIGDGAAAAVVAGGRAFVPVKQTLAAIDAADGRVIWQRNKAFPKVVTQMEMTSSGLLVRGAFSLDSNGRRLWHPYLALLDPATGEARWNTDDEKPRLEVRSFFVVHDSTIVVALPEDLATLDLASGKMLQRVGRPKFQGGEEPCCLERDEDGVVVSSSQNVQRLRNDGSLAYNKYFKAPGTSFWQKVGTTALMAGLSAAVTAPLGPNAPVPEGLGETYVSMLTYRYKATLVANQFMYVFTSDPSPAGREGFSVVCIDKRTGEETGRVWFVDRSPFYTIDPPTATLVSADGKMVRAAKFSGGGDR